MFIVVGDGNVKSSLLFRVVPMPVAMIYALVSAPIIWKGYMRFIRTKGKKRILTYYYFIIIYGIIYFYVRMNGHTSYRVNLDIVCSVPFLLIIFVLVCFR